MGLAVLSLAAAGCVGPHDSEPKTPHVHVVGTISGNTYISPRGDFSVPCPVNPDEGGRVLHDDPQSVTFFDNLGNRVSFYSKQFNEKSALNTLPQSHERGQALESFSKLIYGSDIEPHYNPNMLDGATSFIYIKTSGIKTGVGAFIHGGRIFLVETDLLPGADWVSKNDEDSQRQKEKWLEDRALGLLQSMDVK
jgi:hypothetical protein